MPRSGFRQEVLNVCLAQLLGERGIVSVPEQAYKNADVDHAKFPDVLVTYQGLRTAIEGEVGDQSNAHEKALESARKRVEKNIALIGVAIVYPKPLRQKRHLDELNTALSKAVLEIAVCSEAGEQDWAQGDLDYLADLLRRTFHSLVKEDVVTEAVEQLNGGVADFAQYALANPTFIERATSILGVGEPPRPGKELEEEEDDD